MGSTKRGLAMVALTVVALAAIGIALGSSGTGSGDDGAAAASGSKRDGRCGAPQRSLEALEDAVGDAGEGEAVCLADGSYGKLELGDAGTRPPRVIVRAAHPGRATLAGAELGRSKVTLARFVVTDSIDVEPGTVGVAVAHNRVTGGYLGVDAGPTDT